MPPFLQRRLGIQGEKVQLTEICHKRQMANGVEAFFVWHGQDSTDARPLATECVLHM